MSNAGGGDSAHWPLGGTRAANPAKPQTYQELADIKLFGLHFTVLDLSRAGYEEVGLRARIGHLFPSRLAF